LEKQPATAPKLTLPATTATDPGRPSAPSDSDLQLNGLQEQVRQLQADKTILESKLKEAFAAQPAAVDPRELAKAEEKLRALQKENDLLKVTLNEAKAKPAPVTNVGSQRSNEPKFQEAEVEAQKSSDLTALRAENQALKKQLADLKTPAQTTSKVEVVPGTAKTRSEPSVQSSNQELQNQARLALENRLQELSVGPAPATVPAPRSSPGLPIQDATLNPADATRIKQLERERDDLQRKLAAALREASGRKGKANGPRLEEMENQLSALRARLEVFEARQVPYAAEELALFKRPEGKLSSADLASGKNSGKGLPAGAASLVAEARRYFADKRLDKAEEKYAEVLHKDEKNVYTLANLATIQLELGHLADAEKHINQAVALAPDDAYSLSILGYLRFKQQKYDEALDALSHAAKLEPENPEIQNYLGLTLGQKGLRGPAETALRKAIQMNPGYGSAHNNLAVIYLSQQPPAIELARWHYQKALAVGHPRNPELEKMLETRKLAEIKP
ncbi:MAG TPA: tetratricopeptide repeat protein, partial [Verrucomicrobiae bacterium]|nr:tetratricopeptide repeat protein [Verrucomicrobiae bacterium]